MVTHPLSVVTGTDSELISAVEMELDKVIQGKEEAVETKKQQLVLLKGLTKNLSEPTVDLVAKLNCETKRAMILNAR